MTVDVQFSYSLIYLFQLAVNEAVQMYFYVLYAAPVMATCLNMKLLQRRDCYHLQQPVYYLFIHFHLHLSVTESVHRVLVYTWFVSNCGSLSVFKI